MAVFAYQGRSAAGLQKGEIEAADRMSAVGELRRRSVLVTQIAEKAGGEEPEPRRREGQGQGDGDLHPPVLHHDRRRPAARPVPQHPGRAERLEEPARRHGDRGPVGRGGLDARRVAPPPPAHVRRPLHQPGRGGRDGRYPRRRPAATRRLHREGRLAQAQGQVRHGLSGHHHQRGHARHRLHARRSSSRRSRRCSRRWAPSCRFPRGSSSGCRTSCAATSGSSGWPSPAPCTASGATTGRRTGGPSSTP